MAIMHFLIVDDEEMVRRTIAREIRTAHPDNSITEAASGEEALAKMDSKDAPLFVNVVISENSMLGRMRGLEFLREARRRLPRSIRILVSADQLEPAEMADAVGSGLLFAYFSKPWHGEIFRATIQRAVRKIVDQETVRFPPDHQ